MFVFGISQVDSRIIPLCWLSDIDLFKNKIKEADIIIIDSYLANQEYYQLSSFAAKVPVFFDDYSRIKYPEGIIINGSPGVDESLYSSKTKKTTLLTGLFYQMVKEEFKKVSDRNHKPLIENVLITIGGISNPVLLNSIISVVKEHLPLVTLHVIADEVKQGTSVKAYSGISASEMNKLMKLCDFAITGAGQTIFELMITGIPFIALQTVANQKYNASGLHKINENIVIKNIEKDFKIKLSKAINYLIPNKNRIELSEKSQELIDEQGARRIVTEMLKQGITDWFTIRKVIAKDLMNVFYLSNEPEVRKNSFWPGKILLTNHTEWFQKTIKDKSILFLIAEIKEVFTGQIRYRISENECAVGISVCSQFRGLSIGEKLLKESIPILKSEFPEVKVINAWVKPENTGSNKLFIKAGYQLIKENDPDNYNAKKYKLNI